MTDRIRLVLRFCEECNKPAVCTMEKYETKVLGYSNDENGDLQMDIEQERKIVHL